MKEKKIKVEKEKVIAIGKNCLTRKELLSLLTCRPLDDLFYLLGGDWQLKYDPSKIKGYTILKARSSKIKPVRLYKTSNYQETVRIGKKIYKDLSSKIYKRICIDWELCKKFKKFDDDSVLILNIAFLLTGITGRIVNTLTIATILFKMRLNKFCKCILKG